MLTSKLRICLVEPFYSGSHKRWADELRECSSHRIDLITLPGRHWKWRMHGAAITLAHEFLSRNIDYDLILVSDMLDLTTFLALIRHGHPNACVAAYFHENQLCYPWSPRDKDVKANRDLHYSFINYSTALAADIVYFNSNYHKLAFLDALPHFLARYPDFENKETIPLIADKCKTLPLGLDLRKFDQFKPESPAPGAVPILLWNHRWEYDKNPKGFCRLVEQLLGKGLEFEIALLGECFEEEPEYFSKLRQKLGRRVLAYGWIDSFQTYAQWLWRANIIPVTSVQDFFGGSIVEAVYCETQPVLPRRLAYPEIFGANDLDASFYESLDEGVAITAELISSGAWKSPGARFDGLIAYDWSHQIDRYDQAFSEALQRKPNKDAS